jgi:hypothetical protein
MFSVFCPRHGHVMLLGPRRIVSLRALDDRVEIDWVCYCGEFGTTNFEKVTDGARRAA